MSGRLASLFARELRLGVRAGGGALAGALFFLVLVATMPLALGPDLALLARIGPALLWLGALLAGLLGLERLFQSDFEDGSLDLMAMSDIPLELIVLAKAAAHWVTSGLALALCAPVFGLMLNVPPAALGGLALTLLAGTPALTMIGAVGAALTVALRRGGLLVPILTLPLSVPVLIFGIAATQAAAGGTVPPAMPLLALAGLSVAALALAPFAAAAALRSALE